MDVVKSGMTVTQVPPKHFTNPNPSDQEYREYYNSHITASITEKTVIQFRNTSNYITDFSTSPCLFPAAIRPIVDLAVVNRTNYIWLEGQRMVGMVGMVKDAVTRRREAQLQRDLPKHRNTRDTEHPSPLKQTTLKYTADWQLGLAETHQPLGNAPTTCQLPVQFCNFPQYVYKVTKTTDFFVTYFPSEPRIVSMAQLQAIRKAQQAFSEYVQSEQITSGWSSYNGSEISYMNRLEFQVVQERISAQNDDMVLLSRLIGH